MKLFKLFKTFRDEESGAVTVDWVVLTAAIVALAIFVGGIIFDNAGRIASTIDGQLDGVAAIQGEEPGQQ